jgi:hypothetical protein
MPDELSTLLERVAADGADRSRLSAEAVRARGAGLRRRRMVAAGLGSAALVAGLLGGVAALARPPSVPAVAGDAPSVGFPKTGSPTAGSTTVATPPRTGAVCRIPAVAGDVDGDCKADQVSVSGDLVVVRGTRAGRLSVTVHSAAPLRIAAVADADQDGFADVWVRTGTSNAYIVVRYDGKVLATISDDQGRPLQLRLDGPPTRYLLGCYAHDLNLYSRTSLPNGPTKAVIWLVTRESTHAVC